MHAAISQFLLVFHKSNNGLKPGYRLITCTKTKWDTWPKQEISLCNHSHCDVTFSFWREINNNYGTDQDPWLWLIDYQMNLWTVVGPISRPPSNVFHNNKPNSGSLRSEPLDWDSSRGSSFLLRATFRWTFHTWQCGSDQTQQPEQSLRNHTTTVNPCFFSFLRQTLKALYWFWWSDVSTLQCVLGNQEQRD